MPPPSLFYDIHVLSYTVIDVENEVRHSIDHHRMAIIIPGSCWPYGDTIQQCWPGYVCLDRDSLTQSPLVSNWSPNRSQSPPTANLHLLPFFLLHILIKRHATRLSECAVTFPAYTHIQLVPTPSKILWSDSSHPTLFMFGIFQAEERDERIRETKEQLQVIMWKMWVLFVGFESVACENRFLIVNGLCRWRWLYLLYAITLTRALIYSQCLFLC